jgi:NCAIR mutase (PurE)-related protein
MSRAEDKATPPDRSYQRISEGLTFDLRRDHRRGLPEVVYGEGKSESQLVILLDRLLSSGTRPLITRLPDQTAKRLAERFPEMAHYAEARLLAPRELPPPKLEHPIAVLSAGASDEAVAEEAALSARFLGAPVERFYDVGVACLQRILDLAPRLDDFAVLIVVAGMEGALPSVVAGLTRTPVLAVPTSVGYGANLGGVSALLGMINSCAGGVSVFNIDNGFGAAYQAVLIARKMACQ